MQVGVVCPSRMPEFFLVTLMSGSETTRHHQRDFIISPPPNVDVCTILPRISGGNVAGTSPIEKVVVGNCFSDSALNQHKTVQTNIYFAIVCSDDSTESTTTVSTAAVSTDASTGSTRSEGGRQQGVSTTLIGKVCRDVT